jgi:ribonuclease T2
MRWVAAVAAVSLVALAAGPAEARHHRGGSGSRDDIQAAGGPENFDYFLLSLSLAPDFCALSPANAAKQECRSLTEAAFEQTPLTVHGLWPNRARVSVNRQPHDCGGSPFVAPSGDTQTELRRYMPGGPGLERYEWQKHGSCSGLSPDAYFAAVVRLARQANDTIGAVMRSQGMLGHSISIADLLTAVGRVDAALAPAVVVDCQQPRGGGDTLVEEIRVVLSKDLQPIAASSVGLGQNSGCPGGRGRVAEVR